MFGSEIQGPFQNSTGVGVVECPVVDSRTDLGGWV